MKDARLEDLVKHDLMNAFTELLNTRANTGDEVTVAAAVLVLAKKVEELTEAVNDAGGNITQMLDLIQAK